MKTLIVGIVCLISTILPAWSQDTLTLAQCYQAAAQHYPYVKQKGLLSQTGALSVLNLKVNRWLPQASINGQATWQSEVTRLPIELPGIQVPQLSKDQYKVTLDASYALYDGDANRLQQKLQKETTALEVQQVEVELQKLKEQVNLFFLNAQLAEENMKLLETLQKDLKNRIDKLSANVRYGTAAQTSADALQAEYLKTTQKLSELQISRKGLKEMLALLTGLPVEATTPLSLGTEEVSIAHVTTSNHPQVKVFTLQRSQVDIQNKLTGSSLQPRLSAFAQTGAGRPALNFLNNDFRSFFLGGVKLSWPISNGYNLRREQQIHSLRKQIIQTRQETFEKNLALQLRQQQSEVERYQAMLEQDKEIVALRTKIKQSAGTQLENGAIAARDYISELNQESEALLNQNLHRLQWQMAKLQYVTLSGN
ncbi:TolC family protein [Rhodocytophaga rosea]|uniref:TolC family protein n=1 Tax=Rhodocytophaga rosea TaxID=2704465 RepID=A0A6C0GSH1_9BACT|nr:TolC family protein [Rhodocytophaga rosea]QHT71058.1 TolC family protein [Rhodocytophaga rosea]